MDNLDDEEEHVTPSQALFHVAVSTGWFGANQRDIAKVLGVDPSNLSKYLAPLESPNRIRASIETIWSWTQILAEETDLLPELRLEPDGEAVLVTSGRRRDGEKITIEIRLEEPGWRRRGGTT